MRVSAVLALLVPSIVAFLGPLSNHVPQQRSLPSLFLSAEEEEGINNMRRLLESSWNDSIMGPVPTNVQIAAEAAVTCLRSAQERTSSGIFYVDLLLPQYDVRQGSSLYDEVLAVELCIALANRISGKSAIVVKDQRTIETVTRILDARERRMVEVDDEEDDEDEDDEDIELYEDFADFGLIGNADDDDSDSEPTTDDVDVDSFRQRLISGWELDEASNADSSPIVDEQSDESPPSESSKSYRLASMLGSEEISAGADMFEKVVQLVQIHAQPTDDEDTIIILSAATQQEMIGVRSLVAKYEGKKTILLVNCSLNPVPRELTAAQTVYSIQPLIARPKVSEANLFGQPASTENQSPPPKVVVMRRYPRDWEVFVDIDSSGFELAATIPADRVDKKGPPMDVIAGCVKHHLQSKMG